MDIAEPRLVRKRESRTRAPTACQTCRLRKTRCDNTRPICSYCAIQGVDCIYPETSPHPVQASSDSTNNEILSQLSHLTSLIEEMKQDRGSTIFSTRSLRSSFFDMGMHSNNSPRDDLLSGSNNLHGSSSGLEDRPGDHDPMALYAANSAEYMLRWPVFNKVITESERHIRSFLLDSLDSQPQSGIPPRQIGIGLLDDIQCLCKKYLRLIHRRNPVLDREKLEHYAREVTVQGPGWDGQSCQVLLACALGCTVSNFIPLDEIPEDLDRLSGPPPTDANIELAEAYFHAAKQRFGSLHTSPTDIACFLLAGSYHRHVMRPLQAWFCFQQASCRLEVRLRSLCRKQWTADADYNNLESRLYWSCIQAEHEMQSELPLWSSGLESLGYSDPFPSKANSTSPEDKMEDDSDSPAKPPSDNNRSDEERGWILYIGAICNRRTVNDMLIDMWRSGEDEWITNVGSVVQRTAEAVKVVDYWHDMSQEKLALASPRPEPDSKNLHFYFWARRAISLEKIYRPILYLAVHYHSLPAYLQSNTQLFHEVSSQAQKAIDNCAELIPHWWYHHRHEWIWSILRSTFGAAVQIIAAVLGTLNARRTGVWMLHPPRRWAALVRVAIKTLGYWGGESIDVELMRATLERMYLNTCRLVGEPANMFTA
ncbi:uncharacterized protein N7496_004639 [Penicillium cataractarum]|uniref:Zn(2)-C6 fungal-type domain-containing protein n=1 Tax=Penicillium cataractarum TaxID=2100454 RepID=A0A9W9VF59_9EURO|nr:uncharacterized protein N7496_004639 [Penicillium cataractarum]KAJ5377230.1 hypothetical protein N7496_004639 [Penicillium cataractarum]